MLVWIGVQIIALTICNYSQNILQHYAFVQLGENQKADFVSITLKQNLENETYDSVYELYLEGHYQEAFDELSGANYSPKNYLLFIIAFSRRMLPLFIILVVLSLFLKNTRFFRILYETSRDEGASLIIRQLAVVLLLFFLLNHLLYNPLSGEFIQQICLSVFLYKKPIDPIFHWFLPNMISLCLVPLYFMKVNNIPIRDLFSADGKRVKIILSYLAKGALISIYLLGAFITFYAVSRNWSHAGSGATVIPKRATPADLDYYAIFLIAMAGPFFEEIFFRGMLYLSLRKHFKSYVSMFFSALFFAAVPSHFSTHPGLIWTFGTGLIYAFLVEKTGSLWPSYLLHMGWNSLLLKMILLRG